MATHEVTVTRTAAGFRASCSCRKLDTTGVTDEQSVRQAAFLHQRNPSGAVATAPSREEARNGSVAGMVREPDHDTSVEGARSVLRRAPNQRLALLAQYRVVADQHRTMAERAADDGDDGGDMITDQGLTDEEAGELAGLLDSCYWRRCTDLRADGWTVYHPDGLKRKGRAGTRRKVSIITPEGRAALARREGEVEE